MSHAFGYGSPRMDATMLVGVALGGFATHAWRGVILRRGWLELEFRRLLPRLAAGVILASLVVELMVWQVGLYVTHAYTWKTSTPGVMFATTFNWIFTLFLWTALYVGSHWFVRWRLSEISAGKLSSTRSAQIQPHFLFNAMNVLRA
jgi:hypothetical protein